MKHRLFVLLIMTSAIAGEAAAPSIHALSRGNAAPGESVTIRGTDFGDSAGYVVVAGLRITPASWSGAEVTWTVPVEGCSGLLYLRETGGAVSNKLRFTVKRDLPAGQFEPENLELIDTGLTGAAFLIETDGSFFYGISGFETLNTYQIRVDDRPELRSRIYLPHRVGDIRVHDGHLFCAGDHGLSVYRCADLQQGAAEPIAAVFVGACLGVDVREKAGAPVDGTLIALCEYLPRADTGLLHVYLYQFASGDLIPLGVYARNASAEERQHAIAIDPLNPKVYVSGFRTLLGNDKYILELNVSDPTSPVLHHREETRGLLAFDMDARGDRLWAGVVNTGNTFFQAYELKPGVDHLTSGPTVRGAFGLGRATRVRIVDDDVTVGCAWSGARPDVFVLETFGYGSSVAASDNSLDWAFDVTGYAEGAGRGKILVADEWGGFITYNYERPSGYTINHAQDYRWAVASAMTEGIRVFEDRLYIANRGAGVWSADRFDLADDSDWRWVPWAWDQEEPQPHPISGVQMRRDPVRGVLIAALGHEKAMAWGQKVYGMLYQETADEIVLLAMSEEIDPPGLWSSGVSVLWPETDLVYMVTGTEGFRAYVVNPETPSIALHKDCRAQGFAADVFSDANIAICMGDCTVGGQYKIVVGSKPGLLVSSPTLHVFDVAYPEGIPDRAHPDRSIVITRAGALECSGFKTVTHLDVSPTGLVAAATGQGVALFDLSWIPQLNSLLSFQAWNKIHIPNEAYGLWWHDTWSNGFHDVRFVGETGLYAVKTPEGVWKVELAIDGANHTHSCFATAYYPGVQCGIDYTHLLQGWGDPDIVTLHHPYGLASDGDSVYVTGWSGKVQRLQMGKAAVRSSWQLY